MTDTDVVAAVEEAEQVAEEANDAALADVELPDIDPEVRKLYVNLRDLDARGTSNNLEVGRLLCDLIDAGETTTQIAARSRELGIMNVASIANVSRLSAFAILIDAALEDFPNDFVIPAEGSVRPLTKDKAPDGSEWKLAERLDFLADAVKIAAEEQAPLRRPHIKVALERKYPPPPKPTTLPVSPRVRKVTTQFERLARELGVDAVLKAAAAYIAKHESEATAEGDQGDRPEEAA